MPPIVRLVLAGAAAIAASASHALTINYTFLPGTSDQAQQAIRLAGAEWTSVIQTDITVDLNFETGLRLGSGVLGTTKPLTLDVFYSDFRSHLAQVSSSALDASAVASLPVGARVDRMINRTSDGPAGSGSATPYVDRSMIGIHLTAANARAIGMPFQTNPSPGCAAACDARIDISTRYQYDYDPSDGISPGSYDFVGVAAHEIGHALGFLSGVDALDAAASPRSAAQYSFVDALDLFRYSSLSAASHAIDFTADDRSKYFSIDGGVTAGPAFSEGEYYGDGSQASHWKDGDGIGVMEPYLAPGVAASRISAADLQAMDAIGWTVSAVPEPASAMLLTMGLAGLCALRRRHHLASSR